MRRADFLSLTIAALLGMAAPAWAQSWPSRPVQIIVPFAAGTLTDVTTRALGKALSERLGQPVVIENRPGAAGNLGTAAAAKAAPDGYTLMMGTNGPMAANRALYKSLPFDPVRDFVPVIHVVTAPLVMVAGPGVPVKTVQDVVQLAKANPGKLNFGVTNTTARAWVELFKKMAGVQVESIQYQAPGAMINDLVGGRIQLSIENVAPVLPLIKDRKITGVALMNPSRAPYAPDLPALAESGYTQYDVVGWLGIFAPRGTPAEVVARLNREISTALRSPEVTSVVTTFGIPAGGTPEQLAELQKRDLALWAEVAESAGIRAE
ncbi:MAG TPA: tripartite tricarboxylate transporter substrate binding protein [Ramlibacter sp.]|nr:tripartite tricarboxylate transporter substrate binding protein [Ramlibacter sp.]